MSHKITALYQMLQIFPRLEFRRLALVSYLLPDPLVLQRNLKLCNRSIFLIKSLSCEMNWKRCGKALKRMLKGDNNLSSKQKKVLHSLGYIN